MASDRSGGGGSHQILRGSSSSLTFIDVAFSDIPLSPEGVGNSSYELHGIGNRAASDCRYSSRSCSSIEGSQQKMEDSVGHTRRLSLTSRFFLPEFFNAEPRAKGHVDDGSRRDSTCSTGSVDIVLSVGPSNENLASRAKQEHRPPNVAIFTTDPADKVMHSMAMTLRLLWATGVMLLISGVAMAAIAQVTISYIFRIVREVRESLKPEEEGTHPASYQLTIQTPVMRATGWIPTQIVSDSLYAILVLLSIIRWRLLQRRLRAAVLVRFVFCLVVGLALKLALTASFWFAYQPMGAHLNFDSYGEAALVALRFILGLTLPESADGIPGYGRMITSQLFVFWLLYTWHTPVLLLLSTVLTLSIYVLGSVDGFRSVFDILLALFIVTVISVFYHQLLDSAARNLFFKLRAELGTRETQVNEHHVHERLTAVYTPTVRVSQPRVDTSNFYGCLLQGSFISQKLWDFLSSWAALLESLEEMVRYTLRSCGLHLAQQHKVHFILPPRNSQVLGKRGSLSVVTRATGSSGIHILADDRMIWTSISECYMPRPTFFAEQQIQKLACCVQKLSIRDDEDDKTPPGVVIFTP